MKRIISIALVALMLVALALPVIAALPAGSTISSNKTGDGVNHLTNDVTVSVTPKDTTVYYKVDIEWGDLNFEYKNAVWNAEKGYYESGTWDESSSVTVTNSSNNAITVTAALSTSGPVNGVTATLENADFILDSATIANGTSERSFRVSRQ
jgi:hypothetical protein